VIATSRLYKRQVAARSGFGEITRSLFLFLTCVAVLLPVIRQGGAQPFRYGIDQLGYAITGQYLRDGGTRPELESSVLKETGQTTLKKALVANSTSVSFNDNIASEFILKSLRFGYPGAIACSSTVCGERFVMNMQMLVLLFPIWLIVSVLVDFLETEMGFSAFASVLSGAAFAANTGLLNVLYEGMHAQIFSMGLVSAILVIWWDLRRGIEVHVSTDIRLRVLLAVLFAMVFATYSEQALILAIFGIILTAGDVLFRSARLIRANMTVFWAAIAGCLLTGPYSLLWFPFIVAHTADVAGGGSGYWQPQWAQASDILGITNAYSPAAPLFIGRSWFGALSIGVLSFILLDLALVSLWLKKVRDQTFWLTPIAFVTLVFIKSFYVDHIHNYNYMKSYTILLFPLFILGVWTIYSISRTISAHISWKRITPHLVFSLPIAFILLNGAIFLRDFQKSARFPPQGIEDLAAPKVSAILADSTLLVYGGSGLDNAIAAAYTPMNWLNVGWSDPFIPPYAGKQILFLCFRDGVSDWQHFLHSNLERTIVSEPDFALITTSFKAEVPYNERLMHGMPILAKLNGAGHPFPLELTPMWNGMVRTLLDQ
jgi:hypothetical protein